MFGFGVNVMQFFVAYFFAYILVTPIAWVLTAIFRLIFGSIGLSVQPQPYTQWPAGRIHLFKGDRTIFSSPRSAFEHRSLNWNDGSISCVLSDHLLDNPEYMPALIGTICVLKPKKDSHVVVAILDNTRASEFGLSSMGTLKGALDAGDCSFLGRFFQVKK
jgi:hypothetical protein